MHEQYIKFAYHLPSKLLCKFANNMRNFCCSRHRPNESVEPLQFTAKNKYSLIKRSLVIFASGTIKFFVKLVICSLNIKINLSLQNKQTFRWCHAHGCWRKYVKWLKFHVLFQFSQIKSKKMHKLIMNMKWYKLRHAQLWLDLFEFHVVVFEKKAYSDVYENRFKVFRPKMKSQPTNQLDIVFC